MDDTPEEFSDEMLAQLHPIPLVKRARIACGMSQTKFAETYQIPIGTLRDWEQSRYEPDATSRAYFTAILNDPESLAAALKKQVA